MIKKLVAAAAVAGGLLALAPQSAPAATQTGTVTVPAGDRRCRAPHSLKQKRPGMSLSLQKGPGPAG